MVVIAAYLVFVVGLAFSSYGKLKLGSKDDTPDFKLWRLGWHVVLVRYRHFAVVLSARPSRWTITSTRRKVCRAAPRGASGIAADLPALGPAWLGDLRTGSVWPWRIFA